MRQVSLRPHDVAVALELALRPGESFTPLAEAVGLSLSEAHAAVGRLTHASLLRVSRHARPGNPRGPDGRGGGSARD